MKLIDSIISGALIILSVIGIVHANTFRDSAGFVPKIIFSGLFLCGVALLINTLRSTNLLPGDTAWRPWLAGAALMVSYVVLMGILGFYIATILFISSTMWAFGVRKWQYLTLIPIGFNIVIYLAFSRILGIMVPMPFFM